MKEGLELNYIGAGLDLMRKILEVEDVPIKQEYYKHEKLNTIPYDRLEFSYINEQALTYIPTIGDMTQLTVLNSGNVNELIIIHHIQSTGIGVKEDVEVVFNNFVETDELEVYYKIELENQDDFFIKTTTKEGADTIPKHTHTVLVTLLQVCKELQLPVLKKMYSVVTDLELIGCEKTEETINYMKDKGGLLWSIVLHTNTYIIEVDSDISNDIGIAITTIDNEETKDTADLEDLFIEKLQGMLSFILIEQQKVRTKMLH